ncbi:MAG TPA: DMT family transporter [Caulobacterales bacterium]|nr:DMT family transporter [Caulobacterales bacterium]
MNTQTVAFYSALSLIAGILIPILAALSGAMGRTLGNPSIAALITTGGAFALVLAYTLASGPLRVAPGSFALLTPLQMAAGFGMAFYVTSITFLAPRFGVGNAVMLVVAAQIASSAAIDHFGLFGAPQKPIDWLRALGLAVMVVGVVIAQLAANGRHPLAQTK